MNPFFFAGAREKTGVREKNRLSSYRYGFNGQEKVDEVTGSTGTSYTAEYWQYDSRLGRRWNTDPKPNPSVSNYACFNNNPIFNVDVNGDTTYRFGGDGKFLGMFDLDIAGIQGSIGKYNTITSTDGSQTECWSGDSYFKFNDPGLDRIQLNGMKVGDQGINIISDENMNWFMDVADIESAYVIFYRWGYVGTESKEGLMDFSYTYLLPGVGISPKDKYDKTKGGDFSGGFFIFGNSTTAYNVNDAGNFLWGFSMAQLDYGVLDAQQSAQANEWWKDAASDQRAITSGVLYKPQITTSKAPDFIIKNRQTFIELSNKAGTKGVKSIIERGGLGWW